MAVSKTEIQRLIECSICCDYLTDVRETPCCHRLFCASCIQSWLQKSTKNCPRCRSTVLTEQILLKNVVIQRLVDNLQFDCPNKLQGCSVQVPKCDLIKHKRLCSYSSEKLALKLRAQVDESRALLLRCKQGKATITENVLYDLAMLFYNEREYEHARECLQMIKEKKNVQDIVILQAQIERDTGQFDEALALYLKAYALANSVPQRIDLLAARGHLYLKKAQYEQAQDTFTQALDLLRVDDKSQIKAELLNALGLIAKKCSNVSEQTRSRTNSLPVLFKYNEAIEIYTRALDIVDSHSKLWSDIVSNLAGRSRFSSYLRFPIAVPTSDVHRKKGNYREARELYLSAIKNSEALHGANHPSIAETMNNLAVLYKKEGNYGEALDYLKQALKIFKHFYGAQHPSIGICLTNVGDIYRKVKNWLASMFERDERCRFLASERFSKVISRQPKRRTKKR